MNQKTKPLILHAEELSVDNHFETFNCPRCQLKFPVKEEYFNWKRAAQEYQEAYKSCAENSYRNAINMAFFKIGEVAGACCLANDYHGVSICNKIIRTLEKIKYKEDSAEVMRETIRN